MRVNSGPPPARNESSPRFRGGFSGSRGGGPSDSENRVHVGNLAWGVDNVALESLFREQGKVLEARVIYDRESGRSRGFGFVTFSSPDEVNSAIQSLDGVVSTLIFPLCKMYVLRMCMVCLFCHVSAYSRIHVNEVGLFCFKIHMSKSDRRNIFYIRNIS